MRISNISKCHLSNPIYRKADQSRDDYLKQQRAYFNNYIKPRRSIFKGLPVRLAKSELSGDECFDKFVYGKEEFHRRLDGEKAKPDRNRLERINWIFEIIDRYDQCLKCGSLFEYQDKKFKDRINIACYYNKYKIVITLANDEDEYVIVSAFFVSQRTI